MNDDSLLRFLHGLRELLPLIIFLVVGPLAIFISYQGRKKSAAKLRDLAAKLGLQFRAEGQPGMFTDAYRERLAAMKTGDRVRAEAAVRRLKQGGFLQSLMSMMQPLGISGKYNAYQVELSLVRRNKKNLTEVRAWYPEPLGLGLAVERQGFLHRSLPFNKAERAESGNPELDKLVAIRARDPLKARYIARNLQAQMALLELFRENGAELNDSGASVKLNGYQTDYARSKKMLDCMTRAMQAVAAAAGMKQASDEQ
jgi:hypothetical protein